MRRTASSKRELQRAGVLARVKAEELRLKDAAEVMRMGYRQASGCGSGTRPGERRR